MAKIIRVSGGEDTTPDDAPRRKMCWKCHRYNSPGAKFCAFCGVGFATDEEHYQTDGRTVSSYDDTAYLTAPPPKTKRKHHIGLAVIVGIIVIFVVIMIIGAGAGERTLQWDYQEVEQNTYGDDTYVTLTLYVSNHTHTNYNGNTFSVHIEYNGISYGSFVLFGVLESGYIMWKDATVRVPSSTPISGYKVTLTTTENVDLQFDGTIHERVPNRQ